MFRVVFVGFLPQLKAIFWCNPCVGKVDTASFWPILWWKCGTPVTESTLVLRRDKKKKTGEHKKTRGERAGWKFGQHRIESKVALLWRMHVLVILVMLPKSSYEPWQFSEDDCDKPLDGMDIGAQAFADGKTWLDNSQVMGKHGMIIELNGWCLVKSTQVFWF